MIWKLLVDNKSQRNLYFKEASNFNIKTAVMPVHDVSITSCMIQAGQHTQLYVHVYNYLKVDSPAWVYVV